MPDALSPARLVEAMHRQDPTAASLGITLGHCDAGTVTVAQPVTEQMLNASGIVHGGFLFLLADTALAYCCASVDRHSVTRSADMCFIAPAYAGSVLTATATIKTSHGRNTICDVSVHADGRLLAESRGHGALIPPTIPRPDK